MTTYSRSTLDWANLLKHVAAAEKHNRCVVDAGRFHQLVIDIPLDTICPRCDLIFNDTAELHLASMEYPPPEGHSFVMNAETPDSKARLCSCCSHGQVQASREKKLWRLLAMDNTRAVLSREPKGKGKGSPPPSSPRRISFGTRIQKGKSPSGKENQPTCCAYKREDCPKGNECL